MNGKEKVEETISDSSIIGKKTTKKKIFLPKVELHIHPPISYKISPKRKGTLILAVPIEEGDTLSDLLIRLDNEDHATWNKIYDLQTKKMRPPIRTILNGKALSPLAFSHTILSYDDQVSFVVVYGGG